MFGARAALLPLVSIFCAKVAFTKVTELPVSNKALTRIPLIKTVEDGLVGSSERVKQVDITVQKLMIADGREDELLLIFLRSFPVCRLGRCCPGSGLPCLMAHERHSDSSSFPGFLQSGDVHAGFLSILPGASGVLCIRS